MGLLIYTDNDNNSDSNDDNNDKTILTHYIL